MAQIETGNGDRAGLAAEYALGTLDEAEKAQAEALMRSDREFAAEVEQWRSHFDPLLAAAPAVPPPSGALDTILSAIDTGTPRPSAEIIRLRRKVAVLQWTAGAAAAIAASLLAFVFIRPAETSKFPQYVSVLETPDRKPAFVVTTDPAGGGLFVRRVGPEPAPGRSYELWAIREAAAPQSLGLVDRSANIPAEELYRKTGGVPLPKILLAVTDEPKGGSLKGEPSGPPIFTGNLIQAPAL